MDDLAGLDWNSSASKKPPTQPAGSNYFPALRPTPPVSGRSTPAAPASLPKPATPQTASNSGNTKDSFANLFQSTNAANSTKNLSLAEQQRRLQEQKAKQLAAVGGTGASEDVWAKLGSGGTGQSTGQASPFSISRPGSTQPIRQSPATTGPRITPAHNPKPPQSLTKDKEEEDDLLAGFKSDAPVDKSSHFPAPVTSNASSARATPTPSAALNDGFGTMPDEDDDPFGLGMSSTKQTYNSHPPATSSLNDDDDILGDLGKPVSELPKRQAPPSWAPKPEANPAVTADRGVAELVDMGFPAEKAQEALEATGGEVQAAVSYLLTQAHGKARSKTQTPSNDERQPRRAEPRQSSQQRESRSPANGEKDPSQVASELGASLWKGANSLWKTSKKQFNKAVSELNESGDPSQPKWMREASSSRPSSSTRDRPTNEKQRPDPGLTHEAAMLDSHDARPPPRSRRQENGSAAGSSPAGSVRSSRDQSPALASQTVSSQPKPAWQQQAQPARSKLSRQVVEEETMQAYVSPARRKKAAPKPKELGVDFFENASPMPVVPSRQPQATIRQPASTPASKSARTVPVRPPAKARAVPPVSSVAMKSCNQHRASGTAAFKRGDYGAAADSYSSAISALPNTHPLIILLYTNRATTRVKTGDSKGALSDADSAIELIGPARGADEAIDVPAEEGTGSSNKDMAQFWGKAMMRRAEALEHMERWTDAGSAWRDCVEAGVGGALSIQGRNRCDQATEKAAAPKPTAAVKKAPSKPPVRPRPAVRRAPESFEAVNKMREANRAAEAVEDEKFRLADSVDDRVNGWRKGKEANLRALLGSLDTVLWTDSGWKKIGMSELLVPGKVKIAYMKGISKVHPDKLPTTATTEQQMISAAVFATLNEAWDKFKAENGL